MKSSVLFVLVGIVCTVTYVHAGCDDADAVKDPEDSDFKNIFKNLGCTIKKGAESLGESAKPWADKIGSSAKDFGSSVAQKYDEIKHKLTDDNNSDNVAGAASSAHLENVPTEKVPLAPLAGDAAHAAAGEQTGELKPLVTPDSFDQRFLFQLDECPKGQVLDHKQRCRPA